MTVGLVSVLSIHAPPVSCLLMSTLPVMTILNVICR